MNKKIVTIAIALIILACSIVLIIKFREYSHEEKEGQGTEEDHPADEIISEIDKNLLDEDDDIEIGEMV